MFNTPTCTSSSCLKLTLFSLSENDSRFLSPVLKLTTAFRLFSSLNSTPVTLRLYNGSFAFIGASDDLSSYETSISFTSKFFSSIRNCGALSFFSAGFSSFSVSCTGFFSSGFPANFSIIPSKLNFPLLSLTTLIFGLSTITLSTTTFLSRRGMIWYSSRSAPRLKRESGTSLSVKENFSILMPFKMLRSNFSIFRPRL